MPEYLQTLREARHMGCTSLARKLPVADSTIRYWEKHGLTKTTYEMREKLAEIFHIDVEELRLEPRPKADGKERS